MDLGGVLMDAGGASSELGLLGGGSTRLLKHGRGNAAGAEDHGWGGGRAKQARTAAAADVVAEAAKAAPPFLLGSCSSPGHGGEQMLSFSSAAAAASSCVSTAAVAADGAVPLYYGTPASCSGEHGAPRAAGGCGAAAAGLLVQSFFFCRLLVDWIRSLESLLSTSFSEYYCLSIRLAFSLCTWNGSYRFIFTTCPCLSCLLSPLFIPEMELICALFRFFYLHSRFMCFS